MLHTALLLAETAAAERLSRYVWYSLFQWVSDQPARFCGDFNKWLSGRLTRCFGARHVFPCASVAASTSAAAH